MDNNENSLIWEHAETCLQQYENYLNSKIIDINDDNRNNKDFLNLLKNHIHINTISEITGEPGSGKTQLCFYLSIITQLTIKESNYSFINDNEVFYINTNRNFTPRRICELVETITKRFNLNNYKIDDFTKKIHVIDINSIDELHAIIVLLKQWLANHRVKILIIDSISFIVKQCNFIERTSLIYTVIQNLRLLARRFKFAIILTNDFTTKITPDGRFDLVPCFGDSFHHCIDTRLLLSKKNTKFLINPTKSVLNSNQAISWEF